MAKFKEYNLSSNNVMTSMYGIALTYQSRGAQVRILQNGFEVKGEPEAISEFKETVRDLQTEIALFDDSPFESDNVIAIIDPRVEITISARPAE